MTGGFCIECGHQIGSFDGLDRCPACGSTSMPCHNDEQVDVSVNWHELRVLVIWAENWQRQHQIGRTVYGIAKRLHAQHPERGTLTLAEELGEIAKAHEVQVSDPALRRDIAEQTGEETGLV
jgi:hypothetical protein